MTCLLTLLMSSVYNALKDLLKDLKIYTTYHSQKYAQIKIQKIIILTFKREKIDIMLDKFQMTQ